MLPSSLRCWALGRQLRSRVNATSCSTGRRFFASGRVLGFGKKYADKSWEDVSKDKGYYSTYQIFFDICWKLFASVGATIHALRADGLPRWCRELECYTRRAA